MIFCSKCEETVSETAGEDFVEFLSSVSQEARDEATKRKPSGVQAFKRQKWFYLFK